MVGPVRQMLPQSPHRRCEYMGFDITDVVEGKKVPDVVPTVVIATTAKRMI